jgi:cysteine desulfurase
MPAPQTDSATPQINLDANANAAPTQAVIAAVIDAMQRSANPSSAHGAGEAARAVLEKARDAVVALSEGLYPENVIFTSGCTEANNLVVSSHARRGGVFITSKVEHPSLLRPAEALAAAGHDVRFLPVDQDGLVDLKTLILWLSEATGPMTVSIQTANSETGVIQPIAAISDIIADYEQVLFHSDAAQSFGKQLTLVGRGRGPDVVSVSGHKLHAPMGVGALLVHDDETRLSAQLLGGEQEQGLRAGTQALPMIAGLAAACEDRARNLTMHAQYMEQLRDRLEGGIRAACPQVVINGARAPRLPNVTNLLFPGVDAMALVANLDAQGILVSQGSACSSRRPEPSHVLTAMDLSEDDAFSSVRFSVSPLNTEAEIDLAIASIAQVYKRFEMFA